MLYLYRPSHVSLLVLDPPSQAKPLSTLVQSSLHPSPDCIQLHTQETTRQRTRMSHSDVCLKVCVDANCQMSLCVASYLASMSTTSSILSVKCILYVRSIRPFGFRHHKPHLGRVGRCHKGTLEGQERNAKDLARPG